MQVIVAAVAAVVVVVVVERGPLRAWFPRAAGGREDGLVGLGSSGLY